MQKLSLDQEIRRGAEAERILTNPLYLEAYATVEKGLIDILKSSPLGDDKTHNRIAISLQLLEQINNAFKTTMETGQMAKIQVNEPNIVDKVKQFVRR